MTNQTANALPAFNARPQATKPGIPALENRAYGIKELAVLYFPNICPASASKRLKQWIMDSPELLAKLSETNYHQRQRIVSPRQKELVVAAFGSPF